MRESIAATVVLPAPVTPSIKKYLDVFIGNTTSGIPSYKASTKASCRPISS
jgi:hypothetical protein